MNHEGAQSNRTKFWNRRLKGGEYNIVQFRNGYAKKARCWRSDFAEYETQPAAAQVEGRQTPEGGP